MQVENFSKKSFKFFDFFANCEYFEKEFEYDEKIKLPTVKILLKNDSKKEEQVEFLDENGNRIFKGPIHLNESDNIKTIC